VKPRTLHSSREEFDRHVLTHAAGDAIVKERPKTNTGRGFLGQHRAVDWGRMSSRVAHSVLNVTTGSILSARRDGR
jgi:hypothetical protein